MTVRSAVSLTTPSGAVHDAVLVRPEGEGPVPGVVVIHDITGLRDDTERHCQRFAEAGFAALAPDLYMGSVGCVLRTMVTMVRQRGAALEVIEAARAHLAGLPEVDAARISVTGFCMGGGFALLAAADGDFAVSAPFYGRVPLGPERLEGICPTIAQFGGRDLLFRRQASWLSRHLDTLGVPHEVVVYPEAGHSFMNDHPGLAFQVSRYTPLRAAYDAEVEARAWAAMLAFLERHG
ncbi:MAG: dienelactone hydrolase family protein [Myxococcota bacterium]